MAKATLITAQTLAAGAAERWARQYRGSELPKFAAITEQLRALGPAPTPEAVVAIIGNDSWTQVPACDGCDAKEPAVVCVGEPADYDSATAYLCASCLGDAVAAMKGAPRG